MDHSFSMFLDNYLNAWRTSSLEQLTEIISPDYQAREIAGEDILDFGYEESVNGWEQGFHFAKENKAQWDIKVISILPLREEETMAILSATMEIQGKRLETANLFFQTFRKDNNTDWKLIRSYIEAGVTLVHTKNVLFK